MKVSDPDPLMAPEVLTALKWLREEKYISVNCSMTTGGSAKYTIMEYKSPGEGWETLVANPASSFREAESEGLNWVLKHLLK